MTVPYLKFAKMNFVQERIVSFEEFHASNALIHSYEPKFGCGDSTTEHYELYVAYMKDRNLSNFSIEKFIIDGDDCIIRAEQTDGFISWIDNSAALNRK